MLIYVKTLSGDLYEMENINKRQILEELYCFYPSVFPKNRTQLIHDKNSENMYYTMVLPKKYKKTEVLKKSYLKNDIVTLYIGISLFDCVERMDFYENNEKSEDQTVDIDVTIFRKQFESVYKKCSIYDTFDVCICNPNKLTIEYNKDKKEYSIFTGNYGQKNVGTVLIEILSKKFSQIVSHTGVLENADCGDEMYPYYKITFFFCEDVVKRLNEMIENEIKYYL